MAKTHLAVQTKGFTKGSMLTTTLCGRSNKREDADGSPDCSTEDHAAVTCKHCLTILANKKNWRHRKFLAAA